MRRSRQRRALRATAVLVAASCACFVPASSEASAVSAFHTPGWALQCFVVAEAAPPVLTCMRLSDGRFASMAATGRARIGVDAKSKGRRDPFAARRLLRYGQYWRFGSIFGCVSRAAGLKCWNRSGHGWTMTRDGTLPF
jgi:hypothetical protein